MGNINLYIEVIHSNLTIKSSIAAATPFNSHLDK